MKKGPLAAVRSPREEEQTSERVLETAEQPERCIVCRSSQYLENQEYSDGYRMVGCVLDGGCGAVTMRHRRATPRQ